MKVKIYQVLIFLIVSSSLMADDNKKLNDSYQKVKELSESTINSLMPSCDLKKTTTGTTHSRESLLDYSCGSELTSVITELDPIIDKCVKNNSTSLSCKALGEEYLRLLKKQAERGQLITLNEY